MAGGPIDGSYGPLINLEGVKVDGKQVRWAYGPQRQGKDFRYIDDNNRDLTPDEINAEWAEKDFLNLLTLMMRILFHGCGFFKTSYTFNSTAEIF